MPAPLNKTITLLMSLITLALLLWSGPAPAQADAQNVEWVGHLGGEVRAVALQGDYAYIGEGYSLAVVDVSNPSAPTAAGKTGFFPSVVQDVAVSGNYAYVADDYDGLRVVNISNPAAPVEAGFYDTPGWGRILAVAVAGNYAYLADRSNGLRVVNVANPAVPVPVGLYSLSYIDTNDVVIAGNYAYVAGSFGLRVVNISNPAAPVETAAFDTPGYAYGLAVSGNYAYIADYNSLRVVNISNPAAPTAAGSYTPPGYGGYVHNVAIAGNYAYLIDSTNGLLRIVDVSNPTAPVESGSYDMPGYAYGVIAANNYVYIANQWYGLRVVNVSNPAAPALTGFYVTIQQAQNVAVSGSYAYVADYYNAVRVVNLETPAAPSGVGYAALPGYGEDVAVAGSYAYVADGSSDLRAVSVNDPANPFETAYAETPGYANGVVVDGQYVYVADQADGLRIMDISNTAAPLPVGYIDTPGNAYDVAIAGNYAYVADYGSGLRIIDISNRAVPVAVGAYTSVTAYGVAVAGQYAYIAAGYRLQVVNISNPAAPVGVGSVTTSGANDVAVAGNYAYMAAGSYGLRVVDISNPAAPTEVGHYDLPSSTGANAQSVTAAGDYLYVADRKFGLMVFRATPPSTISGRIADSGNNPLSGVLVSAGGTISATTNTSGIYVLPNLVAGTYTFTPTRSGYNFSPASRTVSVPPSAAGQDFTSIQVFTIAGQIRDNSSQPIPGVVVAASGGYSTTTNASGRYTITTQLAGTYTLTPTQSGYSFSPSSRTVTVSTGSPSNTWQDFTGTLLLAAPTNLQATAVAASQINLTWQDNSTNESGFRIERSPNGSSSWVEIATVAANVTGYNNTGLAQGTLYYYRVRAYQSSGSLFSAYSNPAYATTLTSQTYSVSGRVTNEASQPLSGVIIQASGGYNATTNANGDCTLLNLPAGTYTLTPSQNGYLFSPASLVVTVSANVGGQNFVGRVNPAPSASVLLAPPTSSSQCQSSYPFVFYTKTVPVNFTGGRLVLSSQATGSGDLNTDDEMTLTVKRPDGSTQTYNHVYGYPAHWGAVVATPPVDVTYLFGLGVNEVTIRLLDNMGCSSGTNGYYLSNPANQVYLPLVIK